MLSPRVFGFISFLRFLIFQGECVVLVVWVRVVLVRGVQIQFSIRVTFENRNGQVINLYVTKSPWKIPDLFRRYL